ncbi:MAG: NUDIX domain-containing protein [Chitinophagaceae bacterium]|nr:NUDIX domain-containing protein [Chitinophagaceae bacterium]
MSQQPNVINVRVYGILIDEQKRILVSDEYIRGDYFTKFPGGGLELGEGAKDCLKREFKEETGLDVVVGAHLYTTDFYQQSAFNKNHQILSIYYYVHCNDLSCLRVHTIPFDFTPEQTANPAGQSEVLRWIDWNALNESTVSLPIDKVVVQLLKN